MKVKLFLLILWVICQACTKPYQGEDLPLITNPPMDWWKDAKFGLFIHWGVYAVPAGIYKNRPIENYSEWIMNHARIPVQEYRQYAQQFNPDNYNPEAWVRLAKAAGMKYLVITTKHHDGFALFDSKVTDWDAVDASPYGKDLLKPLVEACRRENIRIGFYYSQADDWYHPGGATYGGSWDKVQQGDMDTYLDKIAVPQVRELLSNYGPIDILWWDLPTNMSQYRALKFLPIVSQYPNLITNNRLGGGFSGHFDTMEQTIPATIRTDRNWETCMTMNNSWGYSVADTNWKSTRTLIHNLADVVSKGGNFLLNVGPTAAGIISQPSVARLLEIGQWLKINGESIYGTSPGPFTISPYGRVTRKGEKLYLHILNYPTDSSLYIPMVNTVKGAYLLANPVVTIPTVKGNSGTLVKLPAKAPDPINTVVVIDTQGF